MSKELAKACFYSGEERVGQWDHVSWAKIWPRVRQIKKGKRGGGWGIGISVICLPYSHKMHRHKKKDHHYRRIIISNAIYRSTYCILLTSQVIFMTNCMDKYIKVENPTTCPHEILFYSRSIQIVQLHQKHASLSSLICEECSAYSTVHWITSAKVYDPWQAKDTWLTCL